MDLWVTVSTVAIILTGVNLRSPLIDKYGLPIGLPVSILLRDTATQYERVERDILHGSNEEALSFRQSITDECNMTAIAVRLPSAIRYELSDADILLRALL